MDLRTAFSLMYIDVDLFASINERHGRALGDRVLKQIGDRLRAATPPANILVRLYDDEFMLLLASEHAHGLSRIAQTMLNNARTPMHLDGRVVETSISIGAALHPAHGQDIHALMKCAESAMHRVKASGRNGYHLFDTDLQYSPSNPSKA